jgi:hypothetical protein
MSNMKKHIVITSIFNPTEAIEKFASLNDYELIVVGDKKTPLGWAYNNVKYLSIDDQEGVSGKLYKSLPFNHYCRKIIGYVYAAKNGADVLIDTDDDNIPKENWIFPETTGTFDFVPENQGYTNIYQAYSSAPIWPRGLPLKLITKKFNFDNLSQKENCKVGIWQGLADEDPDVDAIYRLTSDVPCFFNERAPIVIGKGTISPFNSQNTLYVKELFPLLYLPCFVTFRFTDILRGLVAQPIMWLHGYTLGFTNATVVQKRNPHDYFKDFISEIPMYTQGESVIDIVSAAISSSNSISENLYKAYEALEKEGIVTAKELEVLALWLEEIS